MKNTVKTFLIGAALIVSTSSFAQEEASPRGQRGEKVKAKMESIFTELELTEEQKVKVKEILKEEREVLKEDRVTKEELASMSDEERKVARAKWVIRKDEVKKSTKERLSEVLSEEQMVALEKIQQERKEEQKAKRKERIEHRLQEQQAPESNG